MGKKKEVEKVEIRDDPNAELKARKTREYETLLAAKAEREKAD